MQCAYKDAYLIFKILNSEDPTEFQISSLQHQVLKILGMKIRGFQASVMLYLKTEFVLILLINLILIKFKKLSHQKKAVQWKEYKRSVIGCLFFLPKLAVHFLNKALVYMSVFYVKMFKLQSDFDVF